jgi:hypothetical protein
MRMRRSRRGSRGSSPRSPPLVFVSHPTPDTHVSSLPVQIPGFGISNATDRAGSLLVVRITQPTPSKQPVSAWYASLRPSNPKFNYTKNEAEDQPSRSIFSWKSSRGHARRHASRGRPYPLTLPLPFCHARPEGDREPPGSANRCTRKRKLCGNVRLRATRDAAASRI